MKRNVTNKIPKLNQFGSTSTQTTVTHKTINISGKTQQLKNQI